MGAEASCTCGTGRPAFTPWCGVDDLGCWGLSPMKLVAVLSALHFLGQNWGCFSFAVFRHSPPQRPENGWVLKSALRYRVSFSLFTMNCLVSQILDASFGGAEISTLLHLTLLSRSPTSHLDLVFRLCASELHCL